MYQAGDLVFFQLDPKIPLPNKLASPFLGPYEVVQQVKNDVECRHLVVGHLRTFHVSRLKPFFGSRADAHSAAQADHDQHVISTFLAYRGTPALRTSVEFEVQFADGQTLWLPWSKDLFDTVQYEDFCRSHRELVTLLSTAAEAAALTKRIRDTPIPLLEVPVQVIPPTVAYIDLRSYGYDWYASLGLPDQDHVTYVVAYQYLRYGNKSQTTLVAICKVLDELYESRRALDAFFVYTYGAILTLGPNMVLVDESFILRYPSILEPSKRARLINAYRNR